MAAFSISRYFTTLFFLLIYFKTLSAYTDASFSFKNFGKDSNFESLLAFYGNAKVTSNGSSLQISDSSVSSPGRVIYKKPIKLVEGSGRGTVSFSMNFSFSMSPKNGDGLAFVMVPVGIPLTVFGNGSFGLSGNRRLRVLGVEFDTRVGDRYGNGNGSLVFVKVGKVSSNNLVSNNGGRLQAWIDYEAGSKRLEIRLCRLGETRPVDPLLWYPIDLSRMWKKQVIIGLSSLSGNSSQKCNLYSWSFKLRQAPNWMHSQPLDPEPFLEKTKAPIGRKRSDCLFKILAALTFGIGCGALGASITLFAWTIFWNKRPVMPEEYAVHPVEFEYKKFKVVVDEAIKNGKT
ncbi:hypothetical protein RJ640_014298 [Escallonia rubra]|uniref:Legume lectin domain-containing protein n=1 Tax=Escallonia rubra TaxID=112253 RepID=A0AA88U681_9ASTE|nr:hypothetical protein RJ640_014298 [Escallonia rubra]